MNINDREKVMRGLETCLQSGAPEDCDECPYLECGTKVVPCLNPLLADALALLKEQERQLKEWEKYAPFLAAHGVLKEGEKDA